MILVTGATGFLGKRVCHMLKSKNMEFVSTSLSSGLDLRDRESTLDFFSQSKPNYVINCAAYVGGIQFGFKHPAELFRNNMEMTLNLLEAARLNRIERIVNPISNCAYPADATLFKEAEFWNGPLHESVLVYGFVRKASWVGAWAYNQQYKIDILNLILSNMYGPEDHFEEERSHAMGALIKKIVHANKNNLPEVVVWGSGKPVREWLHIDDGAEAMIRGLVAPSSIEPVNIGVSKGISILEMAELIKKYVGYTGKLVLDISKPDGAPHKTVDGRKGRELLNWQPSRPFSEGIKQTIEWYLKNGNH